MQKIILSDENLEAKVNLDNGQLISLKLADFEYFHNGGEKGYDGQGWKNSEIVCFPIFGPPTDFQATIGNQTFFLEQHGISRYIDWKVKEKENNSITLVQEYDGEKIPNPKYKSGNGHPEYLNWLPYTLKKTFELEDDKLICSLELTNNSTIVMPYMLGWHPSFKLLGNLIYGKFFYKNEEKADINQVIEESNIGPVTALVEEGANTITYVNKYKAIKVSSNDLDNTMIWSPSIDAGMFCIEHLTKIPLHDGSSHFDNLKEFETLKPGESKTYKIKIKLF